MLGVDRDLGNLPLQYEKLSSFRLRDGPIAAAEDECIRVGRAISHRANGPKPPIICRRTNRWHGVPRHAPLEFHS